ncbi:helix-turn-helix domain-containing protein [Bradyrhizobium sp. sBnM-33]|uniref:helix-turn-helix domain-containing protein n=1 Tax=Bradyrhizobium sp. sBnM-33 TaxID=2831780 RepID=UPI001BCCDA61|nr:helix-turn-helix domain-containing protein [Bradyrhizobium sp. sBnM-33]
MASGVGFAEHRLEALWDEPRSGTPRTIEDARIEAVIVRNLARSRPTPPTGARAAWRGPVGSPSQPSSGYGAPSALQPHRLEQVSCSGTFTNVSATGVRGYLVHGDVNVDSAADFSLQIYTSPTNDLPGGAAGWSLAAWDFFL